MHVKDTSAVFNFNCYFFCRLPYAITSDTVR